MIYLAKTSEHLRCIKITMFFSVNDTSLIPFKDRERKNGLRRVGGCFLSICSKDS